MDIKEVCKKLDITVTDFYKYMGVSVTQLSYHKKENPFKYIDYITAGIINFYGIDHAELLTILELYKMQHKK